MSKTEKNLVKQGWSSEAAKTDAAIIDHGHAMAKGAAAGLQSGFVAVVVRLHTGEEVIREGLVVDGKMSVGGVYGQQVVRHASLPYRLVGGDTWTIPVGGERAVLADGTKVTINSGGNVCDYAANGKVYESVLAAALDITPAV